MNSKKILKILLGLGFSALAITWLVYSVQWSEVYEHLVTAKLQALIIPTLLIALQFYLRINRWHYLLPDYEGREKEETKKVLFNSFNIGNFASYVLPLRAGEFLRPLVLSLKTKHSFPTSFVSVVLERFFDLSCVLALVGVVAFSIAKIPTEFLYGASALSFVAFAILIFIVASVLIPRHLLRFANFFLSKMPQGISLKIESFLQDFLTGASIIKDLSKLFKIIIYTVAIWLVTALGYWASLWLLDVPQSFILGMTITVFLALAVAAPSAPGFAGIYEAACIASFLVFGIEKEQAVAYAIITHLHQYVIVIVLGLMSLFSAGISFSELKNNRLE